MISATRVYNRIENKLSKHSMEFFKKKLAEVWSQSVDDAKLRYAVELRQKFGADWQMAPAREERLIRPMFGKISYSPKRAVPDEITTLDLETFKVHAEELILRTLQDINGLERGRTIYATLAGKIIIETKDTLGKKGYGGQSMEKFRSVSLNSSYGLYDRLAVADMHSHGAHDFPPSPVDCALLLDDPKDPHADTCVFVVTPLRIFIVFRSGQSPTFSASQIENTVQSWDKQIRSQLINQGLELLKEPRLVEQMIQESLLRTYAKQFSWRVFISTDFEKAHLVS